MGACTSLGCGLALGFVLLGLSAAAPTAAHAEQSQQHSAQLEAPASRGLLSMPNPGAAAAALGHGIRGVRRLAFVSSSTDPASSSTDPASNAAQVQPAAGFSISINSSPNPGAAGLAALGSSIGLPGPPGDGPPLQNAPILQVDLGAAQPTQQPADSPKGSSSGSSSTTNPVSLQHNSNGGQRVEQLTNSNSSAGNKAPSSSSSNNSTNSTASHSSNNSETAVAAAALLPLSISSMRRAAQSPLIPAVDYYYKTINGSEDMPLGLPVNPTPGLALTRWVLSAWSISNLSAPAGLVDSTMQRVEQLINNFTRMSPGQVQLSATANVTVPYVFRGISDWSPAATAAMQQAASDAVGGYDPAYITVLLDPPDFGVKTADFLDSNPAPVTTVSDDRQVVFYPVSSNSKRRYSRKLLQQAGSSNSSMPWGAEGPVQHGKTNNQSEWTHVWVSYHRLDPLNVTVLLQSLSAACGGVHLLRGADVTATPCGQHTQQLLQQAGIQIDSGKYVQYLKNKPMVSVSVRLAVGVTEQQAESNTDSLVAMWLAQPRNIAGAINMSGLPDPIGPNALIKWVVTPEIWAAQVPPSPATPIPGNPAGLRAGVIAGITIGGAAFAALTAGVIILLFERRRRQQQADDKTDVASSTSSRRRRRRRPAKPRYLLPDLPPPADEPIATVAADDNEQTAADQAGTSAQDDGLSPDQIRPAMKELGDSVTSAARFELEDDDPPDSADGAGPSSGRTTAAAVVAATGGGGSQRVLAARQALLAERQASAPVAGRDQANTSNASLVSRHGGWVVGGTADAATAEQPLHNKLPTPFDNDTSNGSLDQQSNTTREFSAPQADAVVPGNSVSPVTMLIAGMASGVADGGVVQQEEPLTPPRSSPQSWPLRSLQPSPDHHEAAGSPANKAPVLVSPMVPSAVSNGHFIDQKGPCVEGIGIVSSKVSKSPFVRSYDFSQLASEFPGTDTISCALDPGTAASSGPAGSSSTQELHCIGSTQISVTGDGHYVVLHGSSDRGFA